MFFKKVNEVFEVDESMGEYEEEQEFGLVIHITPIAVYLYISEHGTISSYTTGSGLSMEDEDGKYFEINGNIISLTVSGKSGLEDVLRKYGIYDTKLPLIRVEGVRGI